MPVGIGPAIDKARIERLTCIECEHKGMTYEPWIGQGHYVILALCRCGHAERQG